MSHLSKVLKERLKDRNVSQVARTTGIPASTLHEWLSAKRMPNFKNTIQLKRLAEELGLTLEELIVGDDESKLISAVSFEDNGRHYRIKIERLR